MKQHRTLRFNISFAIVVMIVTFATVVIYFNYSQSRKNTYDMVSTITKQSTQAIIEKTSFYFHKSDSQLKVLANYNQSNSIMELKDTNIKILWDYLESEEHLASIFIADESGNFLQARRNPKLAIREISPIEGKRVDIFEYKSIDFTTEGYTISRALFDPRGRPWYKDIKEGKISITKPYIFASTNEPGITVSYANFDRFGNKVCVSAVDITLTTLLEFIKEQAKIINGEIILVNAKTNELFISSNNKLGNEMINKNIGDINLGLGIAKAMNEYKAGKSTGVIENENGDSFIFSGANFNLNDDLELVLLSIIHEDVILGDVKRSMLITSAVSLLILTTFVYIAMQISKLISQPIIKLSQNINSLTKLNMDVDIVEDSKIKEISEAQRSLIALKSGLESFKKYMPSDLVKILIETNQEAKIGGVEKPLAVMFTDIEGFTTISEKLTPMELTTQLSEYFDHLEKIITINQGTIDKYIGDAIMAFWGAPIDIDEPVVKAVKCALKMQQELGFLNKKWLQEGKAIMNTRIGIHYGGTLVGNIGSHNRMNYTIIGDSVNIASRLEGINKNYKTKIMVSEDVEMIIKDRFHTRFIDQIELKGKTQSTKIFTVEGERE